MAYVRGRLAARLGEPIETCPYKPEARRYALGRIWYLTAKRREWLRGWEDETAESKPFVLEG
jgi:hypothetical protein